LTIEKDSPNLYVAVDASKSARCDWCGTLESESWTHTKMNIYCSKDCYNASTANQQMAFGCCFFMSGPAFILEAVVISNVHPEFMAFAVGWFFLFSIPFLAYGYYNYRRGLSHAKTTPRDSKYSESSSDLTFLRTLSQHVECPNCDGNIDLSEVQEDMIYHCEYCGASGKVEILQTNG
jgi:hypothetical protein